MNHIQRSILTGFLPAALVLKHGVDITASSDNSNSEKCMMAARAITEIFKKPI